MSAKKTAVQAGSFKVALHALHLYVAGIVVSLLQHCQQEWTWSPTLREGDLGSSVTCTSCAELPRGEYTGDLPSALVLEVGSLVITLGLALVLKEKSVDGACAENAPR